MSASLRIAHISDVHVLSRFGVEWRGMLFNKRITGWANMLLSRGRVHRRALLDVVLAEAAARADHVVVTGDVTNLAHESELLEARRLLDELARSVEVSVVPGNHDIYLPQVGGQRRFADHVAPYVTSDRPELAVRLPAGDYPFVRRRGPAAIIGLSSAVPRPPFVSGGMLGHEQLAALDRILRLPEVASATPVVLVHHPPLDVRSRLARLNDGLLDAEHLRHALDRVPRGLLLYGHIHVRERRVLATSAGALDAVAASGAALDHPDPAVRAGFNLYEIAPDGSLARVEAFAVDASGAGVSRVPLAPAP